MPSYVTSTEFATALHQNGGELIVKSRIVPRVALKTVSESGRPSPSSRVCDVKYSHHGYASVEFMNEVLLFKNGSSSDLSVSFDASLPMCVDDEI